MVTAAIAGASETLDALGRPVTQALPNLQEAAHICTEGILRGASRFRVESHEIRLVAYRMYICMPAELHDNP